MLRFCFPRVHAFVVASYNCRHFSSLDGWATGSVSFALWHFQSSGIVHQTPPFSPQCSSKFARSKSRTLASSCHSAYCRSRIIWHDDLRRGRRDRRSTECSNPLFSPQDTDHWPSRFSVLNGSRPFHYLPLAISLTRDSETLVPDSPDHRTPTPAGPGSLPPFHA